MTITTTQPIAPARKKASPLNFDWALLLVVGVLIAFGLMMVFSTTFDWSYREHGDEWKIFWQQVRSLGIGLVVMFVVARLDYHAWKPLAVPMLVATVGALLLVLVIGSRVFNATRGLFNGSYQPSEVAKFMIIVYLSVWLTSKKERINDVTYGLFPYAVVVGVLAGLVLWQPDISATFTIVLVGATMFFLSGADLLHIALGAIVSGGLGYAIVMASSTARARISDYLAGLTNLTETSWHVQQAIIAFINGGFFGRGLGESHQKFQALPTPHTDSVFAVIGEELGLIGCFFVIVMFGLLVWRGARIAANAKDELGAILAAGITTWLAYEVIINIGVMVAALPFAGNALPFISYGGSSLVMALAGIGVLLSISRHDPDSSIPRKTRAAFDYSRGDRRPRISSPRRSE